MTTQPNTEPLKVGEPDGYLDDYNVFYAEKVSGINLRPIWFGRTEPSPAEVNDFDATPAFYIDELTANTIKHTALINGKVRFSNKPTAECTIPVHWSALNQRLAVKEGKAGQWDDSRADEIVSSLYRRFKEWSKRGFGPEDVTWCEVKAEINRLISLSTHPVSDDQQAKDAARYRFLRAQEGRCNSCFAVSMNIGHDWITVYGDELDGAIDGAAKEYIDAALSTTKHEEV